MGYGFDVLCQPCCTQGHPTAFAGGIVVVFRPYEAKLISIHCVRPAILVRPAVPKWYGHQEDC